MSVARSRLMAEVYSYCGEPSDLPLKDGGLPVELVFQILSENEDELLRDLNDSSEGRRVSKEEITLQTDSTEIIFNTSAAAAAYAYLRSDSSSPILYPVDIVKPSSLLQASIDGVLAIAFHDSMQSAELSWLPEDTQLLTIWYDRTGDDDKTQAGTTELGSLYDSYLKLRTAAQCRELMKMEIGKILESRLLRSEEQWQKHVKRGQQQGQGTKSRVFTPPRYRRGVLLLDRARFFVPR